MNPLVSLYAQANRWGLLDNALAQRAFAKAYFAYKALLEDPFTPLVRNRPDLFQGGCILDVGANIGYTASLFAQVLSPEFQVYAFEPEAHNFAMLQKLLRERRLTEKVTPVQAAVGDQPGSAELWINPGHHADHRMITEAFHSVPGAPSKTQRVPVIQLDDFCAKELASKPVCFIKIDVQGYEERVCLGMTHVLAQNPQAHIGLEYAPASIKDLGFDPTHILDFFEQKGYLVYSLTRKRGLKRITYDAVPPSIGPNSYTDLLFSKSGTIVEDKLR